MVEYQGGQVVSKTLVQNELVSVTIFSFDKGEEISTVVLLILATISISTLFGENGLVYKANESKLNTEIAKEKEQIQLAVTVALNHNETPKLAEDRFA